MEMNSVYGFLDPFLIWFYRITGYTFVDFLIGTYVLALIAIVVGEFTISVIYLVNRRAIGTTNDEVVRYQNLSVDAIEAGNKTAYKASNKLANDAFGRTFFTQIAMSAGFLWPIPFALGWMQARFSEVGIQNHLHGLDRGICVRIFPPVCVGLSFFQADQVPDPVFQGNQGSARRRCQPTQRHEVVFRSAAEPQGRQSNNCGLMIHQCDARPPLPAACRDELKHRSMRLAHVLILDDEPDSCNLVKRIVEGLEHTAAAFTDEDAAIGYGASSRVELVILDLKLRRMSGLDVLQRLRQTNPRPQGWSS